MKVSYQWLKELVDFDQDPQTLATLLVGAGLEVASVTPRAVPAGVVVAHVKATERHPNADKLSVCTVDAGTGEDLQIVCGAPNVTAGLRVPCATIGTVIAPDFVIKKAKLRGVESSGMLCSERELGVGDSHEGLMVLGEEHAPGTPLNQLFPDDWIIEIEITPNRGDCLSIKGVAREVSAVTGKPLRKLNSPCTEAGESLDDAIRVVIEDAERCPRYMGRLVRDVRIGPSPAWMKNRLSACGMRPINNVVDITNYILLLFGQPMHAFDYRQIGGKTIVVKRAQDGQAFVTLDGTERTLTAEDLLICDARRAVALAGVMGGQNSEIADSTTEVFLECAYFQPAGVRKTSRRLGLVTESSYRFERGVDPAEGLAEALETCAELIRTLAGGSVAKGVVDACPSPVQPKTVQLRQPRIARVLGVDVGAEQASAYLEALNMPCTARAGDTLTFSVPPYRHDIFAEIDLIEEVGRMYGYDNIPPREHSSVALNQPVQYVDGRSDRVRDVLAFAGLSEAITPTLVPEKWRALLTPDQDAVKLLNPVSPELAQMRTNLLGSMLQVLVHNQNRRAVGNHLFELGTVYLPRPGKKLPEERVKLAVLLEGDFVAGSWGTPPVPGTFYTLKGILARLSQLAGFGPMSVGPCGEQSGWFTEEAAEVRCGGRVSGVMGRVASQVLDAFDARGAVYYAELDVQDALSEKPPIQAYESLPRFPPVERDLALVMPEELPSSVATELIQNASELVESVSVFDVYRGDKLPGGRKSLACSVRLRSKERTLTDKDADGVFARILQTLREAHDIQLRQ
jgi:phenylalanyl-tRNA synthetase beta chain